MERALGVRRIALSMNHEPIAALLNFAKEEGIPMPLRSTGEAGHYDFRTDNIYFFLSDRDQRVRCCVSESALMQFDRRMQRTEQGRLRVFSANRHAIEDIASRNYDRGRFDEDGKTVLIFEMDVSPKRDRKSVV